MAIVCIDGGDGAGKATQANILATRLGAKLFSFPAYDTPAGKAILGNLKNEWAARLTCGLPGHACKDPILNALVLQSLMVTNRMEKGAELVTAAKAGHVCLDRYDASAIVYGTLDGLDTDWIRSINAQLPVKPDLYILLDAPVEESFKRRPERRDRYESDRPFLEKVRIEYLRLFEQEARERGQTGSGALWRIVEGNQPIEKVSEEIWKHVQELL